MSVVEVRVPNHLWEGNEPGSVQSWFFDDGASVSAGSLLCEVMTEKVVNDIVSPASGVLRIRAPSDTIVEKGHLLAVIEQSRDY